MTRVGIAGTASYLPARWMTAAEVASVSGIPEAVVVDKFGLRGKHIAAADEHVSDLAVAAAEALLAEHDVDPASIDVVVYYGSQWKDYMVWQAAPWIAHRLGCVNAFALEFDNVSHGTPMALRLCHDYLAAEPDLRRILAVAASRESYLLDYTNARSRFMFNFGDGAAAALIERDHAANEIIASHAITDGSLSLQVKVPSGGSVEPPWMVDGNGSYHLDVADPAAMKERLDATSLDNFAAVAEGALAKAGLTLADVSLLAGI
ncbi:MAG: 3-oxoacyl-ACP synthase, partial [Gaiellaceae bacterium]